MDWLFPIFFWSLLAIPITIGLYLWAAWQRRQALGLLGDRTLVNRLTAAVSTRRRRWKAAILVTAVAFIGLALAGPRFGSKLREVKREGVDLIIALDVSASMNAEDVLPSRLAKAKFEISRLLDQLTGDRVGLVLFAGDAFVQCPLTLDYSALRLFLDIADGSLIPTPGTNFQAALDRAIQMIEATGNEAGESDRTRALLIVSDGENHVDSEAVIDAARASDLVIFSAGVGELNGVPIPIYNNGRPAGYKEDQSGNVVRTKLEEEALVALARDGGYFRITRTSSSLSEIKEALQRLDKKAFDQQLFEEYEEKYQWPLAVALILLILEFLASDRRKIDVTA